MIMLNALEVIINIGTGGFPEKVARRIRIVNTMAGACVFFPGIYLALYQIIGALLAVVVNLVAITLYGVTFFLNHRKKPELATAWLISVYMIHLFVCAKIVFTFETGFHYFYMAVPAVTFLICDSRQALMRVLLCVFPFLMFLICETVELFPPMIELSGKINMMLHLSSIVFMFTGLLGVIYLFAQNIKKSEEGLEDTISKLEKAMSEIKVLEGLIPICASCKKIRDEQGTWNPLELHIQNRSNATFSHGTCPECSDKLYGDEDWYQEFKQKKRQKDEIKR